MTTTAVGSLAAQVHGQGTGPFRLRILLVRGQKVMLDSDLAELYGVPTGRLNEAVKRNRRRFPEDFMFQLTREEGREVERIRSQVAILKRGQHCKYAPYVSPNRASPCSRRF